MKGSNFFIRNENFKELERFQARCRLPQDRVPSATALCINKSNVDLLTKGNLSHYEMLTQVEQKFKEWSPATFLGYSSINFDDEVIRKEFFKSLRKPYLTNTEGNVRHDALNIVRAAFAIDDNILKTELNPKGNKSMKLESLARLNGFESSGAHSALFDTELTVKVSAPRPPPPSSPPPTRDPPRRESCRSARAAAESAAARRATRR